MIPKLWFERLEESLAMPTWLGAIIIGAGPFLLAEVLSSPLVGELLFDFIVLNTSLMLVVALFTFYTGTYLRREITGLTGYAQTLLKNPVERELPSFSNLASIRWTLVAYAILLTFAVPLFGLGRTSGSLTENLIGEIPFLWLNFVFATFFWTFGYSMYAINKMGKLPLKLKSYTQDRTLGLKPFATASMNSTLIYFATTTSVIVPVVLGGSIPLEFVLLFLVMYPLGLVLFLLPLRSLHAKLVEAKREALAKVAPGMKGSSRSLMVELRLTRRSRMRWPW